MAAVVREASAAALEAFHAAASDRHRVDEREQDLSDRDTLGDLEMLDDKLQGTAAWVVSGRPHPHEKQLANELETLHHRLTDLHAQCADCPRLQDYLNRLQALRTALIDYFHGITEDGQIVDQFHSNLKHLD